MLRPDGRVSTPWVSEHECNGSVQTCTDVRADVDLDGTVDAADVDAVQASPDDPVELTYSGLDNPHFFTGRITDTLHASSLLVSEDSNYHRNQDNRNRTYDPKHGRWLQRDPLGVRPDKSGSISAPRQYTDGMNLHEYVSSRPNQDIDPLGMQNPCCCSVPLVVEDAPYQATAALVNVPMFLWHFTFGHGEDLGLTPAQAKDLMQAKHVQIDIDGAVSAAMYRARLLRLTKGPVARSTFIFPIEGQAVAPSYWRVIIQRFPYNGNATCKISKSVCCEDGTVCISWDADCTISLLGQDRFDFHTPLLKWYQDLFGWPYDIVWYYKTSRYECKSTSFPIKPPTGPLMRMPMCPPSCCACSCPPRRSWP